MRFLAMTTRRWMIFVAVSAVALSAFILFQRWVAGKVALVMRQARETAGLAPGASASGFTIPVSSDIAFWIDLDNFLNRFGITFVVLAVLLSFGIVALLPRAARKPGLPPASTLDKQV